MEVDAGLSSVLGPRFQRVDRLLMVPRLQLVHACNCSTLEAGFSFQTGSTPAAVFTLAIGSSLLLVPIRCWFLARSYLLNCRLLHMCVAGPRLRLVPSVQLIPTLLSASLLMSWRLELVPALPLVPRLQLAPR